MSRRKIGQSGYGGSGISAISRSIAVCDMPTLLTSGELNSYLADIDRQAEELFLRLVKQMAEAEGITETLKASDQMEWVGRMNTCPQTEHPK